MVLDAEMVKGSRVLQLVRRKYCGDPSALVRATALEMLGAAVSVGRVRVFLLWPYALHTRCPVLTRRVLLYQAGSGGGPGGSERVPDPPVLPIVLRAPYAMSTATTPRARILRAPYAMSGTHVRYAATRRARDVSPAVRVQAVAVLVQPAIPLCTSYAEPGTNLAYLHARLLHPGIAMAHLPSCAM
eukprot:2325671-Rhodomonas_salina.1